MDGSTIITGASRGIGFAVASQLAASGQTVFNLDIADPPGDSAAVHCHVDLSDPDATAAALQDITARHQVTRIVNNAGLAYAHALEDTTVAELDRTVAVNLRAVLQCTQAVLPAMKAARFGRIVNISSRSALGKPLRTAYAATKGGVISMTRVWALELASYGITVNAIGPGPIATELYEAVNPPDSPSTQRLVAAIPVKRVGRPEDIAHAVSYFLDERAGFVTGQVLYVCGGLTIGAVGV